MAKQRDHIEIPEKTDASCLQRLFFSWMDPLFLDGSREPLKAENVWRSPDLELSSKRSDDLERLYKEELAQSATVKLFKGRPLLRALARLRFYDWAFCSILKFISELMNFIQPVLLQSILAWTEARDKNIMHPLLVLVAIVVAMALRILAHQFYINLTCGVGVTRRTAFMGLIFRKASKLSYGKGQTIGQAINILSNDAEKMSQGSRLFQNFWWQPCAVIVGMSLLFFYIGPSAFVGFGAMLILLPLQLYLAKVVSSLRRKLYKHSDRRISLLSSIIEGVRAIKLLAWETPLMDKVQKIRQSELKELKNYMIIAMLNYLFMSIAPLLIAAATFASFTLLGNEIKPSTAFTALILLNMLRKPLHMFPRVMNVILDGWIGIERGQRFLNSRELQRPSFRTVEDSSQASVTIKNGSFSWNAIQEIDLGGSQKQSKPAKETTRSGDSNASRSDLVDVQLEVKSGEFVVIVGNVGSGKSTLLNSILGECPAIGASGTDGEISGFYHSLQGSVSYVSQVPFILNATVRDNILFGNEMDSVWYNRVIEACALKLDLMNMPAGDATEIGERGINLSGGQKMRVGLARAVFSKAQIYLFDDPFAAVDAHVGKHIFENVFVGEEAILKDSMRILTTHQHTYMPHADKLLLMEAAEKTGVCRIVETTTPQAACAADGSKIGALFVQFQSSIEGGERSVAERKASKGDRAPEATLDKAISHANVRISKKPGLGKLITKEDQSTGAISTGTWRAYFKQVGHILCFFLVLCFLFREAGKIGMDFWMSDWADAGNGVDGHQYLLIYMLIAFLAIVISVFRSILLVFASLRAAKSLFWNMFDSIMKAPMSWFDTTPTGRILSRFSGDISNIDDRVPQLLRSSMDETFKMVGVIFLVAYLAPLFLLMVPFVAVIFYRVQLQYRRTTRELQRFASTSRSPILNNFSSLLQGLPVIAAFQKTEMWITKHDLAADHNYRFYFLNLVASRWCSLRLEMISLIAVAFVGVYISIVPVGAGLAGAALMNIILITRSLNMFIRTSVELELAMNAVERVDSFTHNIPQESMKSDEAWEMSVPKQWPSAGEIEFDHACLRYRDGMPNALNNMTCTIPGKNKVGIVGRTGAGKSTIALSLFRMVELNAGEIKIDGLNISKMSLKTLRSRLAIVPQVPTLFSGSIRTNIDCFSQFNDEQLWAVLKKVKLDKIVRAVGDSEGLNTAVDVGGTNFSVGQRQLICLARAILQQPRVLVLDECSASIDPATDAILQKMIRTEFLNATVLTIAHRLDTVMDSDNILVLDSGECVEFGPPNELLKDTNGFFRSLHDKFSRE